MIPVRRGTRNTGRSYKPEGHGAGPGRGWPEQSNYTFSIETTGSHGGVGRTRRMGCGEGKGNCEYGKDAHTTRTLYCHLWDRYIKP